MTGNGKIARLPWTIRDELSRRLRDGEPGTPGGRQICGRGAPLRVINLDGQNLRTSRSRTPAPTTTTGASEALAMAVHTPHPLTIADVQANGASRREIQSERDELMTAEEYDEYSIDRLSLAAQLVEHDLVDEYWLMIEPILLGGGKRLFPEQGTARPLELVSVEQAKTGVLIADYRPVR